jgi:hypothetical protein
MLAVKIALRVGSEFSCTRTPRAEILWTSPPCDVQRFRTSGTPVSRSENKRGIGKSPQISSGGFEGGCGARIGGNATRDGEYYTTLQHSPENFGKLMLKVKGSSLFSMGGGGKEGA